MWIPSILKAAARKEVPETGRAEVLVITRDDRLFYSLFAVSMDIGWGIRRARTFEEAWQGLRSRPVQVVVYDECLPRFNWQDALRSFSAFPGHPLVFLAAPEVNEDIWRAVLRCHGYDAVARSAGEKEWIRMLRFAWLTRFADERGNRTTDARAFLPSASIP
jgi:hypothetical protein